MSTESAGPTMRVARSTAGRWPRSRETQRAVLDAASVLFAEKGYDSTSIDDLVKRSGISVGSMYHQFDGKADIFLALAAENLDASVDASRRASEKSRAKGASAEDAYLSGAEAFLLGSWRNRQVSKTMIVDQGPPGYVALRRETEMRLARGVNALRLVGTPPTPDAAALAISALLTAATLQIVEVETAQKARRIARYFTGLIRRLFADDAVA